MIFCVYTFWHFQFFYVFIQIHINVVKLKTISSTYFYTLWWRRIIFQYVWIEHIQARIQEKNSRFPDFIQCLPDFLQRFPDFSQTKFFSRSASANVAIVWIRAWHNKRFFGGNLIWWFSLLSFCFLVLVILGFSWEKKLTYLNKFEERKFHFMDKHQIICSRYRKSANIESIKNVLRRRYSNVFN